MRIVARGLVALVAACGVVGAQDGLDAGPPAARRWLLPEQVTTSAARRGPFPMSVYRTAAGTAGIFLFDRDRGLELAVRREDGSWASRAMPPGLVGDVLLTEHGAEVLLSDLAEPGVRHLAFDAVSGEVRADVRLSGVLPSSAMTSRLLGDARERYALIACERGQLLFAKSEDAGASWSDLRVLARREHADDGSCPPLFRSSRGLHVVFASNGELVQLRSEDGGESWAGDVSPGSRGARQVAGAQVGDALHLVARGSRGFVHVVSRDAGETWQEGAALGEVRRGDLSNFFGLFATGETLAFGYTEAGRSDLHARRAHLVVSHDGGRAWSEAPLTEGLATDSGLPTPWVESDGGLLVAFSAGPPEGERGRSYVLARAFGLGELEWPDGQDAPRWWEAPAPEGVKSGGDTADFEIDAESIAAAAGAARSAVEDALGVGLSDGPTVRLSSAAEIEEVLNVENERVFRNQIADEELADEQRELFCATIARGLLAKYAWNTDEVLVSADGFAHNAELLALPELRSEAVLRAVLVHELVHAVDERRHGFSKRLGELTDTDRILCLEGVIEGNAQRVARAVCAAKGWSEGFDTYTRSIGALPHDPDQTDLDRYTLRIASVRFTTAYLDGERFATAVHEAGGDEAIARAFPRAAGLGRGALPPGVVPRPVESA